MPTTKPSSPRILFLDLETFPNIVTSWGLRIYSGYLDPENITQERSIICASWKWLGERKMYSKCVSIDNVLNDVPVLYAIRDAIHKSDAVVAHNGDKFDLPWIAARSVYYGLSPLPPVIQIDTKKIAKSKFMFNSNRLVYLAEFLHVGKKLKTEFDLWKDCLKGKQSALDKMVRYNKHDVVLLERVYKKLAPYVPAKLNAALFTTKSVCPHCQSANVQRQGIARTIARSYQRWQCQSCGHWYRDRNCIKTR